MLRSISIIAVCAMLTWSASALALTDETSGGLSTTVESDTVPPSSAPPSGATTLPPSSEAPAALAPAPTAPKVAHRKTHTSSAASSVVEVEPSHARLLLNKSTTVYSRPSRSSGKIETAQAGKYVQVTGSTRYYLRVELASGKTGYIAPDAVNLVRPADKFFLLNADSPVFSRPNRWASKVAEVHKGHDVHVIGIAMEYMQIRMKDGREGFIPISALE